mmetsp:Transcript_78192/g.198715  ORF Transcript_78192/g.198715 Transcript_78192/m.198715 type:complete len:259 (-) Transcript_78192:2-778(-)
MARVVQRGEGIVHIAVHKEEVHREVAVSHLGAPILRRRDPSIAPSPGVRNGLVPALHKLEASVVVVAKHTKPRLACQVGPVVDPFEDSLPLGKATGSHGGGTGSAGGLDTAPVKVVPHVEQVSRLTDIGSELHLGRHQQLRAVVDASDQGPLALGSWDRWHTRASEEPSPIPNDEEVLLQLARLKTVIWPSNAIQIGRPPWRLWPCGRGRAHCESAARQRQRREPQKPRRARQRVASAGGHRSRRHGARPLRAVVEHS